MTNLSIYIKKEHYEYLIFLLIPVLNALVEILPTKGMDFIHFGMIRGFVLVFLLFVFIRKRYQNHFVNNFIFFVVIYFALISLMSVNPAFSLYRMVKFATPLFLFPLAIYYVNSIARFEQVMKVICFMLIIITSYLILTNITQSGTSNYGGGFYSGVAKVNITKTLAAIIILLPVIYYCFESTRNRKIIFFMFMIAGVFVIMGLKRSALLSLIVGVAIYALMTPYKTYFIKNTLLISLVLLITSPLYFNIVQDRFEARGEAFDFDVQTSGEQGRMSEIYFIVEVFKESTTIEKLFGHNMFMHMDRRSDSRILHVDYNIFLYGGGIVGLVLFLAIYLVIILEKNRYYPFIKHIKYVRELNACIYASIGLALIMSLAGSWGDVTLRSILFVFSGSCCALFRVIANDSNFNPNLQ